MKLEDTLPDALAEALGRVVAQVRREWLAELEHLKAERRALVAELRLAALGGTTPEPTATAATAAPAKAAGKAKPGTRA